MLLVPWLVLGGTVLFVPEPTLARRRGSDALQLSTGVIEGFSYSPEYDGRTHPGLERIANHAKRLNSGLSPSLPTCSLP